MNHYEMRKKIFIGDIKLMIIVVHQIGSLVMRPFGVRLSYILLNATLIPSKVSTSFIDCWQFYYLVQFIRANFDYNEPMLFIFFEKKLVKLRAF